LDVRTTLYGGDINLHDVIGLLQRPVYVTTQTVELLRELLQLKLLKQLQTINSFHQLFHPERLLETAYLYWFNKRVSTTVTVIDSIT